MWLNGVVNLDIYLSEWGKFGYSPWVNGVVNFNVYLAFGKFGFLFQDLLSPLFAMVNGITNRVGYLR